MDARTNGLTEAEIEELRNSGFEAWLDAREPVADEQDVQDAEKNKED
jgi:hypothetical protein